MSLQRCMRETTSREFAEWQRFIEQDLDNPRREEFYLAQVAAEVRRANAKHPHRVKLDDLMIKLTTKRDTSPQTEAERKQQLARSKARWFAITKATPNTG